MNPTEKAKAEDEKAVVHVGRRNGHNRRRKRNREENSALASHNAIHQATMAVLRENPGNEAAARSFTKIRPGKKGRIMTLIPGIGAKPLDEYRAGVWDEHISQWKVDQAAKLKKQAEQDLAQKQIDESTRIKSEPISCEDDVSGLEAQTSEGFSGHVKTETK